MTTFAGLVLPIRHPETLFWQMTRRQLRKADCLCQRRVSFSRWISTDWNAIIDGVTIARGFAVAKDMTDTGAGEWCRESMKPCFRNGEEFYGV